MATSVGTGIFRRVANVAVFNGKGGLFRVASPSIYKEQKQRMSTGPPPACYGGRHTVTLIPGDGIGPELMLHLKEVFRHAQVPIDFEEHSLCGETEKGGGEVEAAIMAVKRNGVALKGNIHTDLEHLTHVAEKSMNVQLRSVPIGAVVLWIFVVLSITGYKV